MNEAAHAVLGPLASLLDDPTIHTIMVNSPDQIFVSRQAFAIEEVADHFQDAAHLMQVIDHILAPTGRVANESNPIVDVRLRNGSLIHIVMPPVAPEGPTLTIRKMVSESQIPTWETLIEVGSINQEIVDFLRACVKARVNILVSGGTGSGKSTLLNLIANMIHDEARIILIEQEPDLILNHKHVVKLAARPANAEGKGEITLQQLVESAMKMRPDRIVCSAVHDGEVYPLLQAMSGDVEGSMFALHATSPRDALARLEVMIATTNPALPLPSIRQQIARAINLIVELEIMGDGWRRVQKITAVTGLAGDFIQTADIFEFIQTGVDADGTITGYFSNTGHLGRFMEHLRNGRKNWTQWSDMSPFGHGMPPGPFPPMPPMPPPPHAPHAPHAPHEPRPPRPPHRRR